MHALLILNRRKDPVPSLCRVRVVEVLETQEEMETARVKFEDGSTTWASYKRLCSRIEELETKVSALVSEEPPTALAGEIEAETQSA